MPLDTINLPLGGLDDREALMLDAQRSPNLQNIRLRRNRITKRPGIARMEVGAGARTAAMAGFDNVGGEPLVHLFSFPKGDGLAQYDFTTQQWTAIGMPASGDGDLNAFQHWSVVNTLNVVLWSATNHQIRVYSPIPGAAPFPAAPGVADVLSHGIPGVTKLGAMILLAFANRVVAVRTDEDGVLHPTRIRWCVNGDVGKWNPALEGAGLLEVRETSNLPLTGGFVLNGRAYLTKAREIIELVSTGDSTVVFRAGASEVRVSGRGLVAPHSVGLSDYFAYFVGADNVYKWDGSNLQAIGDPIWESLSAAIFMDQPDTGRLQRIIGAYYRRRNEYWLYAPDHLTRNAQNQVVLNATKPVFIYDAQSDRWYRDVVPVDPQWFCPVLPLDVTTTEPPLEAAPREQMTMCTDADFYWFGDGDEFRGAALPPTPWDVTGAATNGTDAPHVPIDSFLETKDYEPQEILRGQGAATLQRFNSLYEVRFQGPPGEAVEVWMSPDQGRNWEREEVVVNEYGVGVAYFLHVFSTLRLKFRALSTKPFDLHGVVQVRWQPAGSNLSLG